jgi:7-cyano-7-deazaguanine synthase
MEPTYNNEDALVVLSGGQDSTTCLYWAKKIFRSVSAISFTYGQKHSNEIDAARHICSRTGTLHKIVDLSFIAELTVSNLFSGSGKIEGSPHPLDDNVPSSFVPYRNLFFLASAAAWAATIKVRHIVTGVCETDYSGYADCRDVFVKSVQETLRLATDFKELMPVIHTPLMRLSKAETFELARSLDCLDVIINDTVTCYYGNNELHSFGRGCKTCPACLLREKGFNEFEQKYGVSKHE